ncbi:MAG TPA: hypothetical protein VMZ52_08880 [Bryobacteraceae bacterium]|nr:hypothetical protein [Bryobacteraceae bacterium]
MAGKKSSTEDSAIVAAAKTIGSAAGKVAAATGLAGAPKPKKGKLQKKDKSGLPRREKKAAKKAAARRSAKSAPAKK